MTDDRFAAPISCPACGTGDPNCRVCLGAGVFMRIGIFRDHACSRCLDGARPERCPSSVPGNCGNPRARND